MMMYFGNNFGNKNTKLLKSTAIAIDLAEAQGFEPWMQVLAHILP